MRTTTRRLMSLLLCSMLFCPYANALPDCIVVLDSSIRPVSTGSSGRFIKITWKVNLQNKTPEAQTGEIVLSFLNSADEVISKTTKIETLKPREKKTVSGSVRLRASLAQKIASCDVSIKTE